MPRMTVKAQRRRYNGALRAWALDQASSVCCCLQLCQRCLCAQVKGLFWNYYSVGLDARRRTASTACACLSSIAI